MSETKTPDWFNPNYPPLSGDDVVGKAAVEGQIVEYPRVTRSMADPPLLNQTVGNISFMLFKEPRTLRTGKPVYGYFKLRGNHAEVTTAQRDAARIIKEVDSKYQVRIAPVGHWLPITDEEGFIKEMVDVKMDDKEVGLRDEAAREKQAEQRKIMRELKEREEEAKQDDIYDDPTSLKYYAMRRVTEMKLREQRENQQKAMDRIHANIIKVSKELKRLEKTHPEYNQPDQDGDIAWIACYNEERRKAGIPDYNPGASEFKEYEEFVDSSDDETEVEV